MTKQKANVVFVNFDLRGEPVVSRHLVRTVYTTAKRTYINRPLGGQQDVVLLKHGPWVGMYATWGWRRCQPGIAAVDPNANVPTPTLFAQWLAAQQQHIPTNDTVLDPRD
jgi:hypothetical protein